MLTLTLSQNQTASSSFRKLIPTSRFPSPLLSDIMEEELVLSRASSSSPDPSKLVIDEDRQSTEDDTDPTSGEVQQGSDTDSEEDFRHPPGDSDSDWDSDYEPSWKHQPKKV